MIDALRQRGTASRSEIARLTGPLADDDHVARHRPPGERASSSSSRRRLEPQGRGRPPTLLRLDPSAGAVVGIYFDHRHLRVAVADLSSTVLAEQWARARRRPRGRRPRSTPPPSSSTSCSPRPGSHAAGVVGVGIGTLRAGRPVDGTVGSTVILPGWAGLNAADELTRRLELPVAVDNDANLGALAEVSFGAGRGLTDVIYVMVSSGIGAGIVLGGRLHRGATGLAGELGHVLVRRATAPSAGAGTAAASRPWPRPTRCSTCCGRLTGPTSRSASWSSCSQPATSGARRVVYDAGREIGRVARRPLQHPHPAAIIVGGDLSAAGEPLAQRDPRSHSTATRCPSVVAALEVKAGVLGDRAEVLGALALVIGDTERLRSAGRSPAVPRSLSHDVAAGRRRGPDRPAGSNEAQSHVTTSRRRHSEEVPPQPQLAHARRSSVVARRRRR